jgi:hypothetical protein
MNFFIWIIIKNYLYNIKNENVLMSIVIQKYEKVKKNNKN